LFFVCTGRYRPQCRDEPVPRFRCRSCGRYFSRQTFRLDYCDHRPECNLPLLRYLCSSSGLRQAGRMLELDVHAVIGKLQKFGRTLAQLHDNLSPRLPDQRTFLLDEEETYEGASIRPLTMPVLIEKETWFVVATAVGPIRRLAPPGTLRRWRQDGDELERGRRPDHSRKCVKATLQALVRRLGDGPLTLRTDQKASYESLAKQAFGARVRHETTAGTRIRTTFNPLFPINSTLAMTRDNLGRLRRRSWLVTKAAPRLQDHLAVFTVYRNYMRRRFNRDAKHETPAMLLGLLPRQLHPREVLAWRQDWGSRSIHPTSICASLSIGEARAIPA
jgi:hypothetical protein